MVYSKSKSPRIKNKYTKKIIKRGGAKGRGPAVFDKGAIVRKDVTRNPGVQAATAATAVGATTFMAVGTAVGLPATSFITSGISSVAMAAIGPFGIGAAASVLAGPISAAVGATLFAFYATYTVARKNRIKKRIKHFIKKQMLDTLDKMDEKSQGTGLANTKYPPLKHYNSYKANVKLFFDEYKIFDKLADIFISFQSSMFHFYPSEKLMLPIHFKKTDVANDPVYIDNNLGSNFICFYDYLTNYNYLYFHCDQLNNGTNRKFLRIKLNSQLLNEGADAVVLHFTKIIQELYNTQETDAPVRGAEASPSNATIDELRRSAANGDELSEADMAMVRKADEEEARRITVRNIQAMQKGEMQKQKKKDQAVKEMVQEVRSQQEVVQPVGQNKEGQKYALQEGGGLLRNDSFSIPDFPIINISDNTNQEEGSKASRVAKTVAKTTKEFSYSAYNKLFSGQSFDIITIDNNNSRNVNRAISKENSITTEFAKNVLNLMQHEPFVRIIIDQINDFKAAYLRDMQEAESKAAEEDEIGITNEIEEEILDVYAENKKQESITDKEDSDKALITAKDDAVKNKEALERDYGDIIRRDQEEKASLEAHTNSMVDLEHKRDEAINYKAETDKEQLRAKELKEAQQKIDAINTSRTTLEQQEAEKAEESGDVDGTGEASGSGSGEVSGAEVEKEEEAGDVDGTGVEAAEEEGARATARAEAPDAQRQRIQQERGGRHGGQDGGGLFGPSTQMQTRGNVIKSSKNKMFQGLRTRKFTEDEKRLFIEFVYYSTYSFYHVFSKTLKVRESEMKKFFNDYVDDLMEMFKKNFSGVVNNSSIYISIARALAITFEKKLGAAFNNKSQSVINGEETRESMMAIDRNRSSTLNETGSIENELKKDKLFSTDSFFNLKNKKIRDFIFKTYRNIKDLEDAMDDSNLGNRQFKVASRLDYRFTVEILGKQPMKQGLIENAQVRQALANVFSGNFGMFKNILEDIDKAIDEFDGIDTDKLFNKLQLKLPKLTSFGRQGIVFAFDERLLKMGSGQSDLLSQQIIQKEKELIELKRKQGSVNKLIQNKGQDGSS